MDRDEQRRGSRRDGYGRREDNGEDAPMPPDSLTIKVFGATIITTGRSLVMVVLLIASLSSLFWAGWIHHTEMLAWEQRSEQQLSELIYVLSLPQERREELNIAMPDTLRKKLGWKRGRGGRVEEQ